jgi:ClpX C4-type zinc finger
VVESTALEMRDQPYCLVLPRPSLSGFIGFAGSCRAPSSPLSRPVSSRPVPIRVPTSGAAVRRSWRVLRSRHEGLSDLQRRRLCLREPSRPAMGRRVQSSGRLRLWSRCALRLQYRRSARRPVRPPADSVALAVGDRTKRIADDAMIAKRMREAEANPPPRYPARCSFCRKGEGETDCLVQFGAQHICADCSDLLGSMVAANRARR